MAALVLGFIFLKVIQKLCSIIPAPDYAQFGTFTTVVSDVANIFRWANTFLPVNILLILLSLTAMLFSIKIFWKIIKLFIDIFK